MGNKSLPTSNFRFQWKCCLNKICVKTQTDLPWFCSAHFPIFVTMHIFLGLTMIPSKTSVTWWRRYETYSRKLHFSWIPETQKCVNVIKTRPRSLLVYSKIIFTDLFSRQTQHFNTARSFIYFSATCFGRFIGPSSDRNAST
jgi:hypothetical protein